MKELTIEQKAKAYNEAKLRMIAAYNSNRCTIGFMNEIFPELKESEGEKIKRIIKSALKTYFEGNLSVGTNDTDYAECLTWLKKQGEQKPADKIQLGKKYKCIASPRYSTFMTGEIYKPEDKFLCSLMNFCSDCFEPIEDDSEQKPTNNHFTSEQASILNKHIDKFLEQKPAWSEEDERIYQSIIDDTVQENQLDDKQINWLKSLKDRVQPQPKQEWSEEDRRIFSNINFYIRKACDYLHFDKENIKEAINWLKSLKDRVQAQLKQDSTDRFFEGFKKGEQSVIENYGKYGLCKPTKWSEEDELHIRKLEDLVKRVWAIAEHENDKETIHEMSDLSFFLKTLKPQLKQEWSKDDEDYFDAIIAKLEVTQEDAALTDNQMNFLKSLKSRVQPKQDILEKLEKWLDEYVSDLADVDTASLICSFTNYLDGKLPKSLRPSSSRVMNS